MSAYRATFDVSFRGDAIKAFRLLEQHVGQLGHTFTATGKRAHNAMQQMDKSLASTTKHMREANATSNKWFGAMGRGLSMVGGLLGSFAGLAISAGRAVLGFVTSIMRLVHWLTLAGAASLVGALAFGVKNAADLEAMMKRIQGVTGATAAATAVLSAKFRELAKTSTFTAGQFAEAGYYLASAGFGPAEISASVSGIAKLSEAFGTDLATAAATVVAIISQYGLEASDATRIANVFAAANAKSMAEMDKLAYAFVYVGTTAAGMGISVEETAAALMMLYDAGLGGSMAGTALRGTLLGLISPSKGVVKQLQALGLTSKDVNPAVVGLATALDNMKRVMGGTGAAMQEFGVRAGAGATILLKGAGDALRKNTAAVTGTQQAFTQAAIQLESLKGAGKYAVSSIQELAIVFGDPLLRPLREAVMALSDFVNMLAGDPRVRRLAEAFGQVATVLKDQFIGYLKWLQANWPVVWQKMVQTVGWVVVRLAGYYGAIIGGLAKLVELAQRNHGMWSKGWAWVAQQIGKAAGIVVRVIIALEAVFDAFIRNGAIKSLPEFLFEVFRQALFAVTTMTKKMTDEMSKWAAGLAVLLLALAAAAGAAGLAPLAAKLGAMAGAMGLFGLKAAAMSTAMRLLANELEAATYEKFTAGLENMAAVIDRLMGGALGLGKVFIDAFAGADAGAAEMGRTIEGLLGGAAPGGGSGGLKGSLGEIVRAMGEGLTGGMRGAQAFFDSLAKSPLGGANLGGLPGGIMPHVPGEEAAVEAMKELALKITEKTNEIMGLKDPMDRLTYIQQLMTEKLQSVKDELSSFREAVKEWKEAEAKHLEEQFQGMNREQIRALAIPQIMQQIKDSMSFEMVSRMDPNKLQTMLYQMARAETYKGTFGQIKGAAKETWGVGTKAYFDRMDEKSKQDEYLLGIRIAVEQVAVTAWQKIVEAAERLQKWSEFERKSGELRGMKEAMSKGFVYEPEPGAASIPWHQLPQTGSMMPKSWGGYPDIPGPAPIMLPEAPPLLSPAAPGAAMQKLGKQAGLAPASFSPRGGGLAGLAAGLAEAMTGAGLSGSGGARGNNNPLSGVGPGNFPLGELSKAITAASIQRSGSSGAPLLPSQSFTGSNSGSRALKQAAPFPPVTSSLDFAPQMATGVPRWNESTWTGGAGTNMITGQDFQKSFAKNAGMFGGSQGLGNPSAGQRMGLLSGAMSGMFGGNGGGAGGPEVSPDLIASLRAAGRGAEATAMLNNYSASMRGPGQLVSDNSNNWQKAEAGLPQRGGSGGNMISGSGTNITINAPDWSDENPRDRARRISEEVYDEVMYQQTQNGRAAASEY